MSGFIVREARNADRIAIGRLWRELMAYHRALDSRFIIASDGEEKYVRHAYEMMRSRDARVLIAADSDSGEIIGYVIGEIQRRPPMAMPGIYGFISDMYIMEDWRRYGVGSALFMDLKSWFISRKAQAIELYIADANPVAIDFWQKMGLAPFLKLMHLDL